MSKALENKVAIITGGGRGLGRAFALKYAEEGARLLLPDISLERAERVAAEIKAKGGEAVAMLTDISDENAVKNIAAAVIRQYGRVDILLNNAAVYYGIDTKPWDAWTVEEWDRIFAVNVKGTWLVSGAIAPLMAKQGKGKIINIASNIPHVSPSQVFLPYAVSKGAVYTLTHAMARALGPSGINVNAIAPGYTATDASLTQVDSEQTFRLSVSEQCFARREKPEDLVGTAVFLASEASDFITGNIIYVDGGTVMV